MHPVLTLTMHLHSWSLAWTLLMYSDPSVNLSFHSKLGFSSVSYRFNTTAAAFAACKCGADSSACLCGLSPALSSAPRTAALVLTLRNPPSFTLPSHSSQSQSQGQGRGVIYAFQLRFGFSRSVSHPR